MGLIDILGHTISRFWQIKNRHLCNRTKTLQVFSRNKYTTGLVIKYKRIILASLLSLYCLKLEKNQSANLCHSFSGTG